MDWRECLIVFHPRRTPEGLGGKSGGRGESRRVEAYPKIEANRVDRDATRLASARA